MSESITDRESFENSYYYFVGALKVLSATVEVQRVILGSTSVGVAWELKSDVSAGVYLFNCESCTLSPSQRAQITALISRLKSVPENADMGHASWEPLRKEAATLLESLAPTTRANAAYFNGKQT